MAMLSVAPRAADGAAMAPFVEAFGRRVRATPPGTCPISLQLALLQASGCQTCGKCVPCRDLIPQLERLLSRVLSCVADEADLALARRLAAEVRDASDCAVGWQAGALVLEGMDAFAAEYESHLRARACRAGVGQTVPCETDCPAHVDVPAYLALAGQGDCAGAVAMVRKDNPFPTACAYICEHPCEGRCRRSLVDAPLNIRGVKKFAVDTVAADRVPTPRPSAPTGRRVAVVGGGAAGLTCAYFCALMGHSVTVFEGRAKLGGMLRYGIPAYRFPRARLDEDIRAILGAGDIEARTGSHVGPGELARLSAEHDAVFLAIGAQGGKTLDLPGADADGVFSAVEVLGAIGDGRMPDYTGLDVVVIGGGNVAMDCARTAVRCGAASVSVAYRRRLQDMTALPAEVASAQAEGVEMMTLQAPDHIEVSPEGRCAAVVTQPQYIGAVKRGRPAPQRADKPPVRLPADVVLIAVGQEILSDELAPAGVAADRGKRIVTDEFLRVPGLPNAFAGGDCQLGTRTAVQAIGQGRVAARNIDEFLGYHHKLSCDVSAPEAAPGDRTEYGRVEVVERPARERRGDFGAVEVPMSEEEARQECARCLRCDVFGCGAMEGGRVRYE